jgi:hypothetical protein
MAWPSTVAITGLRSGTRLGPTEPVVGVEARGISRAFAKWTWFPWGVLCSRELADAALGVDVELSAHGFEVSSVGEAGTPLQAAGRRCPENADSLAKDIVVLEQVRFLLQREAGQERRAFAGRQRRPGPLDPLGDGVGHVLIIVCEYSL